MTQYHSSNRLKIHYSLFELIDSDILADLKMSNSEFWGGFESIVSEFHDTNKNLLNEREKLQKKIDDWFLANKDDFGQEKYQTFLDKIGYLEPEVDDFKIGSKNMDAEIAKIAGPQLVVPVNNSRYALNAANARYGSLYDALYGTNALSPLGSNEHKIRSKEVIKYVREFLDECFEINNGSHKDAISYKVENKKLVIELNDAVITALKDSNQFIGYTGETYQPESIVLKKHNLHLIIYFDRNDAIGGGDPAGIKDVVIESAVSSIIDCEDSVSAVDAQDKTEVYQNWLGLMRGDLEASFTKGGKKITRKLNSNISYFTKDGNKAELKATSLLLIRNVGHLTQSRAVLFNNQPVYEGMLDAYITSAIASLNLKGKSSYLNSKAGSIYIVKPKMHGSSEVQFANDLFTRIEEKLGLEQNTIKLGIMDEERRTSVNLKACVYVVKNRVCFINTGFLDRTGDEIHTHIELAPVNLKAEFKTAPWMIAYEKSNVDIGLHTGFMDKAQIGKGMWAKSDDMKSMLDEKMEHLKQGGSCAWVPSPTAASLHAMHYFKLNVKEVQKELLNREPVNRSEILEVFSLNKSLDKKTIQSELENNCQGILGYVVRWIDSGVGCSKVPDISGTALMEDRATLRISSQHIANWLHHNIVNQSQVRTALKKMARLVDSQNENDSTYQPMSLDFENSIAFSAASDLIFKGKNQPSGYTELLLHQKRTDKKEQMQKVNTEQNKQTQLNKANEPNRVNEIQMN